MLGHALRVMLLALFWLPPTAFAGPPQVGRDTTYYTEPLDGEGYVDYIKALNQDFGDADAAPRDNVYVGLLAVTDLPRWNDEYLERLYPPPRHRPVRCE